jgi:tetratricopeptide (TPR) repeat protein
MRNTARFFALALLLTLALPAKADDALKAIRDAHTDYKRISLEWEAACNSASDDLRAAQGDAQIKAARDNLAKVYRQAALAQTRARDNFLDAFAKSDWNAWDAAKDAAVLEDGLAELALREFAKDPAQSVKAWEALLAKLPRCGYAAAARVVFLPLALASTGDFEAAIKRISELARDAREDDKPYLLMALGDTRALGGDIASALDEFRAALKLIPGNVAESSGAGQTRASLELRLKLLGQAAPELDSKTWLGGEPKKLSELKGSVVVLNFWASYSAPCLNNLPALHDLCIAHLHEGLKVLGVTRIYDQGYVPVDMNDLRSGARTGQVLQGLDEAAFKQHLWDFRERTKLSFPFVLGTLEDFSAYGAASLPTTIVVDRQGKVAFIAAGGMREHLVRIATQRALKAK